MPPRVRSHSPPLSFLCAAVSALLLLEGIAASPWAEYLGIKGKGVPVEEEIVSPGTAPVEPAPPKLPAESATRPEPWDPSTTWIFAVSSTEWKYWPEGKMPKKGRQDVELVAAWKERGVPEEQIVFLKDKAATLPNIHQQFVALLKRTQPGDTLFFYFQGHGSRDIEKTRSVFYFMNYDFQEEDTGSYFYVDWVFDMVEKYFRGARALMLADCCDSGGMAITAKRRNVAGQLRHSYACLNSTYGHNTSTGEWTYTDALIRGFRGDASLDLNRDGTVELHEMGEYTEERMAFIEEQRSIFFTYRGFNPRLQISPSSGECEVPFGRFVDVKWSGDGKWYEAEILETRNGRFRVRFKVDGTEEWTTRKNLRPHPPGREFPRGTLVLAKADDDGEFHPAKVRNTLRGLHFVRFDDDPTGLKDQWVAPDAIKRR